MPKINFLVPTRDNPKIYNLTPFEFSAVPMVDSTVLIDAEAYIARNVQYSYNRCRDTVEAITVTLDRLIPRLSR